MQFARSILNLLEGSEPATCWVDVQNISIWEQNVLFPSVSGTSRGGGGEPTTEIGHSRGKPSSIHRVTHFAHFKYLAILDHKISIILGQSHIQNFLNGAMF